MKLTKKRLAFTILSIVFVGVVPLVLVFWQYGAIKGGDGFKLGFGGVLVAALVFFALKKLLIDRWLDGLRTQANTHVADLRVETDAGKIANLEAELRKARTIDAVVRAVLPLLLFVAAIIACKAMEAGVVRLGNVLAAVTASYIVGVVFDVLAAREVVGKHREDNGG